MANIGLPKGYKLNDYTISKRLSSGGFSIVYLAYNKNEEPFAIKEFFPNSLTLRERGEAISFINKNEEERFKNLLKAFKEEAEIVMNLKHRNIIEIIDFFEQNRTAYLVMPFEYGMTLAKYIGTNPIPIEEEIINIAIGVFSAVQKIHENNVIHLDLKPGNIWLRPNKEALILDFGTARKLNDKEKANKLPMFTPGYAAPEQHKKYFHPSRIGVWTDYYGLGTTLYALINSKSPNSAQTLLDYKIKVSEKHGGKVSSANIQDYVFERKGQFNPKLLEITTQLMNLNWERRKAVDLNKIIEELKSIIPFKPVELLSDFFNIESK